MTRVVAAALIAVMVLGSLAMWTAIPIAGLWIASQLTDSSTDIGIAPLIVVAVGIPAAMVLAARLLLRVEHRYIRVAGAGTASQSRLAPAWARGLGDSSSVQLSVLTRIMVVSVLVAATAMAVWFFAFAGSSIPG
jgi:hypothetical protein